MGGMSVEALDVLARTMAQICEDPFDRVLSMAVRDDSPWERMAELGEQGSVEFMWTNLRG
jgi:hypothetical protein